MPDLKNNIPDPMETQITQKTGQRTAIALAAGFVALAAMAGFLWFNFSTPAPKANTNAKIIKKATGPMWRTPEQAVAEGKIPQAKQLLQVDVSYDRDRDPILEIGELYRLTGQAPKTSTETADYVMQVTNADGQVLTEQGFNIPNRLDVPPTEDGSVDATVNTLLTKTSFSFTFAWTDGATTVKILDADKEVVTTKTFSEPQVIPSHKNFRSIGGQEFLNGNKEQARNWTEGLIPTASAQTATPTLDLVFIGDNYLTTADLDIFHNDVNRFISNLLTYQPFKARASQMVFHYIDNTSDLQCVHDATVPRAISCSDTAITQAVNAAAIPYDKIAVIVKDSNYGGLGGTYAIAYNGSSGPQVFVHEFGHSIAWTGSGTGVLPSYVIDEYDNYGKTGSILNAPYYNCYSGNPPAADWNGIVGLQDYQLVCYYPNWYESSQGSIMKALGYNYFNAISQRKLNESFNFWAAPSVDITAPVVTLTSPSTGSTVSKAISVSGTATDDYGVGWTTLWVDGVAMVTDYSAPYSFTWDTTLVANGSHTLQIKAYDAANNLGQSILTTVNVSNVADVNGPTVSISSPVNGATVAGAIVVSATASDNVGVAGVQFKVDGVNLGVEDTIAPYSVTWDTATSGSGSHLVTAIARDSSGNTTTSSPVTVTVFVPLTISGVSTSSITTTSATIKWTSNVASTGTVTLATGQTLTDTNLSTTHSVTFTGLVKGTRYNFTINGTSTNNGSATASGSFRTKTK